MQYTSANPCTRSRITGMLPPVISLTRNSVTVDTMRYVMYAGNASVTNSSRRSCANSSNFPSTVAMSFLWGELLERCRFCGAANCSTSAFA
jgi:hypothetical protein